MTPSPRILTLDVIRGVAVIGILVANLPAFALPAAAYFSPLAWGGTSLADVTVWFATFVLVEGKLRALFTMLFGASMLLVLDRAAVAGENAAGVHFRRMTVLFAIGCAHLYLLWWGDILAHYALVGSIAFLFHALRARWLALLGVAFLLLDMLSSGSATIALFQSAARTTPGEIAMWDAFASAFGVPPMRELAAEISAIRGPWTTGVAWRWDHALSPIAALPLIGAETLSAMLLGMATYRSGFLTGEWQPAQYRRIAIACLGIALPAYALLGANTMMHGFDQRWVAFASTVASAPFRVIAAFGYAALLVLSMRPSGWLTRRLAATGRAAFTNYIGTSLAMTAIFDGWGFGLFATVPRALLYLIAPIIWILMLVWSKPWLDRFAYGPLEWIWRSLSRLEVQPLRRGDTATKC